MKRLLCALFLALTLAAAPAHTRPVSEVEIIASPEHLDINQGLVLEAFELMSIHYSAEFRNFIADWPSKVYFVDGPSYWLGCYGAWCLNELDETLEKNYSDPTLIHANAIYINAGLIKRVWGHDPELMRGVLLLVIAHELGHHSLSVSGVSISIQHELMIRPDQAIARAIGIRYFWTRKDFGLP